MLDLLRGRDAGCYYHGHILAAHPVFAALDLERLAREGPELAFVAFHIADRLESVAADDYQSVLSWTEPGEGVILIVAGGAPYDTGGVVEGVLVVVDSNQTLEYRGEIKRSMLLLMYIRIAKTNRNIRAFGSGTRPTTVTPVCCKPE